jgi:hypothetical protein
LGLAVEDIKQFAIDLVLNDFMEVGQELLGRGEEVCRI